MTDAVATPSAATRRRLAFAAAATVAATVWAAVQDDPAPDVAAPIRPSPRSAPTAEAVAASAALPWPRLPAAESRVPWRAALPQGLAAWGPPPPPPPSPARAPAAPAAPQPPPFPYTLIGRIDDGQQRALLSNNARSFGAKASDVIDGVWRVDAVDPAGVTLTWLPGDIKRTLGFPAS